MRTMKFHSTDPGYCRVYYKCERRLYCVQEEGHGAYEFYRCSTEGEPSHPVSLDGIVFEPIPAAEGDEVGFNNFLADRGVLLEEVSQ